MAAAVHKRPTGSWNVMSASYASSQSLKHQCWNVVLLQVLKRLPNLKKLDGIPVDVDERDQALQARGGS